ncbi:MAG: M28 family peptidase, partial [Blastocatellia bacterium]
MLRKFRVALLCLTLLVSPLSAFAQGPAATPDPDIQAKIRKEGMDNSQIMHVMHYFTDVYGPRLTGSPNHEAAAKWAIKEMANWGFTNAHLEPWDFGHAGWLNERATAHVLSPFKEPLMVEVLGWTPSTKRTVKA